MFDYPPRFEKPAHHFLYDRDALFLDQSLLCHAVCFVLRCLFSLEDGFARIFDSRDIFVPAFAKYDNTLGDNLPTCCPDHDDTNDWDVAEGPTHWLIHGCTSFRKDFDTLLLLCRLSKVEVLQNSNDSCCIALQQLHSGVNASLRLQLAQQRFETGVLMRPPQLFGGLLWSWETLSGL